MERTPHIRTARELDRRENDGITVILLWHGADRLTVEVSDSRTGEVFILPARPGDALDTFRHPFSRAGADGPARRQLRLARNA
jgi:hypothetical protein